MANKPKTKRVRESGGAALVRSGKKPILLPATAEEHDLLRRAAEALSGGPDRLRISMTQLALRGALKEAKNILENLSKRH